MTHPIRDEEWLDYIEGVCSSTTRARIDEHAGTCSDCRDKRDQLLAWDDCIRHEAGLIRSKFRVDPARLEALASDFVSKLHRGAQTSESEERIRLAVRVLRRILSLMCGANAAESLFQAAARKAASGPVEAVGTDTWRAFMSEFRSAIRSLYGVSTAKMVQTVADKLTWELAA